MGRVRWYNYLLGLVFILGGYILSVTLLSPFISKLLNFNRTSSFIGINLSFVILFTFSLLITKIYNKVPISSVINIRGRINFKRLGFGIVLWSILLSLSLLFTILFNKESLIFSRDYKKFLLFILLSLGLTPFQIMAEEYIFRGYLIRLLQGINRNPIFITLISSLIFAILHMANPEVKEDKLLFLLVYLIMAIFLTVITLIKGGMEYAVGIHFANNYFAINFLNYPDSPLPSYPLFYSLEDVAPLESLITLVILISIASVGIYLKEKHDKERNI